MYYTIKYKIKKVYQRFTKGYADEEWWNLDLYTAEFLIPRLKELRDNGHCYPQEFKTRKRWKKELDLMIKGFELYIEGQLRNLSYREDRIVKKGLNSFKNNFPMLWD